MDKPSRRTGILGAGAIGSVLAALLKENPANELFVYNRSPRTAIRIRRYDKLIDFPISMQEAGGAFPELDWLLICLKAYQYEGARASLARLIGPATQVAVIRNGLGHTADALPFADPERILPVIIDCPTQPDADSWYRQLRPPRLTVPAGQLAGDFAALFAGTALQLEAVADFKTAAWRKLCPGAALGAILCLSGESCWIFRDPPARSLFRKLLEEAVAVARADGARLSPQFVEEQMETLSSYPDDKSSSMLADRQAGRPIELEAKNRIIASLGARYQIPTPLNDLVCGLLRYTNNKTSIC